MDQFASYQQFFSPQEAEPIIAVLQQNGIPHKLIKMRGQLDKIILGNIYNEQYDLQIPPQEFDRVSDLLRNSIKVNIDELDKDHYLFSMSREELEEIIASPDNWTRHDYIAAKELLKRMDAKKKN